MRFLIRWGISTVAVAVAAWIVPGIWIGGSHRLLTALLVALVLGLVNAVIRPFVSLMSCGLIVLTLGLFTLVINGLMFWLASWASDALLGLAFHVDGFWSAFWGAIIVSITSVLLSIFVGKKRLGTR